MRNILWNTKTRRNKVFPMWLVLCAFVFLFSVESNAQFRINLGGGSPLRKLQIAEMAINNLYVDTVNEEKLVEDAKIRCLSYSLRLTVLPRKWV